MGKEEARKQQGGTHNEPPCSLQPLSSKTEALNSVCFRHGRAAGGLGGAGSRAFPLVSATSTSVFLFLALTPAVLSGIDVLQDLAQVFALLTML